MERERTRSLASLRVLREPSAPPAGQLDATDAKPLGASTNPEASATTEAGPDDGAAGAVDAGDASSAPDASQTCGGGQSTSDLPGVQLLVTSGPCVVTQAQALGGVQFGFRLTIAADVPGVVAFDTAHGACLRPDASGLIVTETIAGAGQMYCPTCDQGRCTVNASPTTAKAGTYDYVLTWTGRNWQGPSDTGVPMGAAFPTGQYTLTATAKGTRTVDASSVPFTVAVTRPLTVQ